MPSDTHVYKSAAGCQIRADVHAPPAGAGRVPVVVWIHGGCLIYGSRRGLHREQLRRYLDAGFAVVCIDYRLAPETKLPAIAQDLDDACAWVRTALPDLAPVDPDRVGVVGHSAGGYLALLAGARVEPRPRALVSFYGYGDIVGPWYAEPDPFYCRQPPVSEAESGRHRAGPVLSEPYDGRGKDRLYLYLRQRGLWPLEVGGVDPKVDLAFFASYCPVRNVTAAYPPTLLLHGGADTDVPCAQSVEMAAALAAHGVEHELVTIDGGPHGFDGAMDDPAVARVFDGAVAFLTRQLRA